MGASTQKKKKKIGKLLKMYLIFWRKALWGLVFGSQFSISTRSSTGDAGQKPS